MLPSRALPHRKGATPEARWTPDGVEAAGAVVQAEEGEEGDDMPRSVRCCMHAEKRIILAIIIR
ncbi:hypothetical protein CT3_18070 [Comamonas terrigena NBRC 13299]|nr:hypothetical protein CT3_18070 [Comamonas terrigena NBRC 13299]